VRSMSAKMVPCESGCSERTNRILGMNVSLAMDGIAWTIKPLCHAKDCLKCPTSRQFLTRRDQTK